MAAAIANLHAGALDAAHGLVAMAATASTDVQRARVEQLTGQIAAASGPTSEAPVRLLQAAITLEPLDVQLARDSYFRAWSRLSALSTARSREVSASRAFVRRSTATS
jgi:hypothetical protein